MKISYFAIALFLTSSNAAAQHVRRRIPGNVSGKKSSRGLTEVGGQPAPANNPIPCETEKVVETRKSITMGVVLEEKGFARLI